MGNIKLSRRELLQQSRKIRSIKEEIDRIIRETSNTYDILSRVSEVSVLSTRRDLDNVRISATKTSRNLGNLSNSINNAVKLYDKKEIEINLKSLIEIKDNKWISSLRDEAKGALLGYNPRDFLKVKYFTDFGFKFVKNDTDILIKSTLKNEINTNKRYQFVRDQFTEYLGGTAKWDKKFLEDIVNSEGIKLFNKETGYGYKKNINKLKNSKFETLVDAIDDIEEGLTQSIPQKMGSGIKNEFFDGINIIDDFKPSSWKNAAVSTKVSHGIGALGTVVTVVDNLSNFKNSEGKVDINVDNTVDFVVDVGVDLGVGAGAAAIGGAVGSLILPPLGTAVGMAVGVAAGVVLNTEWIGNPPKSPVDYIKDGANKIADVVTEGIGDLCISIGSGLKTIFW